MTEINAQMVKQLRQRTGAGIMDCKGALEEANGDEDKAVEIIQKKGLAKVVKKAGAIAAEGTIFAYIHPGNRLGVLVEVNCETDFVARNEEFKAFAEHVAMQIASMTPQYVRREDISDTDKSNNLKLFKEQVIEEMKKTGSKKPDQVVDKIVAGKLEKWMTDACLAEQISVIENEKSIGQLCDELSAKLGEKIVIRRFTRYELGEGLERKKSDLAAEVASSLAQS
jgi:elongation factor Ts